MKAQQVKFPITEIFSSIEGEGSRAGFSTTFIRFFGCNLRCSWCDTPYSYYPAQSGGQLSLEELAAGVRELGNSYICLTGGEPLLQGEKLLSLLQELVAMDIVKDIHLETNGAVAINNFADWRVRHGILGKKVRFIMDFKLPDSGEMGSMVWENFNLLESDDEIKFVIASEKDFWTAVKTLDIVQKGIILFSPVWEKMPPRRLVELVLKNHLTNVKVSLQLHKIIWDKDRRGV